MLYHHQYLKRTTTNFVTENHHASYRGLGQDGPGVMGQEWTPTFGTATQRTRSSPVPGVVAVYQE